jgi:hypothetical protein
LRLRLLSLTRVVLLVLALGAVALGSQAASAESSTVFAKKADAICTDYRGRVSQIPTPSSTSDFPAVYQLAVKTLAIARLEVAKVHALALPATNRSLATAWVATRDRLLVLLLPLRDAAKRKDANAVADALKALNSNGAHARSLASRLGMKVCSVA